MRVNGQAITLEKYLDGKATGEAQTFAKADECKDFAMDDPDKKTRYVMTSISHHDGNEPTQLMANVDIKGPVSFCDRRLKTPAPGRLNVLAPEEIVGS